MVLETGAEQMTPVTREAISASAEALALDECLETVVQWIARHHGKEYFVEPLEAFAAQWGKSFPEDSFYQDRMNYFLEHCILERPMTGSSAGYTPFTRYLQDAGGQLLFKDSAWRSFSDFRHSLFEVVKSGAGQLMVKDLLGDRTYQVRPKKGETLKFIPKKSIFQGFLFAGEGVHYLGQGLIIHPDRARKLLMKVTKAQKRVPRVNHESILRTLALTNMRFLRMKHVDPAAIYQHILG